jgi:GT2 family glycosyltransferase
VAFIDFVVSARNNRELIGRTLTSIARQTVVPASCTLVDGASNDGTPQYVREEFPWVDVLVKSTDSGPSASRNLGAARGTTEWIALVDSDVELAPTWSERQLTHCAADSRIGIASGILRYASRPHIVQAAHGVLNRYGVAWHGGGGLPVTALTQPRRCLWVPTAAVMMRRALLAECGGFDAIMYAFYEDVDLGWRANLLGYRVVCNPEAWALHAEHGTINDVTFSHQRAVYHIWRNRLRSLLINSGRAHLMRYGTVFVALSILDMLRAGPRGAKAAAIAWNVRHAADTLRQRRRVQRTRRVRDADLIGLFESGLRGPGYSMVRGATDVAGPPASQARDDIECGFST